MVGGVSSEANGNEEQAISGCLAAGVYLFWFRLFCSSPIDDAPKSYPFLLDKLILYGYIPIAQIRTFL